MRITNKIMQNNSLSNINTNKILQDKLNTQMITESKITRPSDDPVIAIRALRLRTTLSELTQYSEKNVEDAEAWLKATATALDTASTVVTDMYDEFVKGAADVLDTTNRQSVMEKLKDLRDELYQAGDTDFGGRNVFTGYRTGTKLRFHSATTDTYRITEQLDRDSLDTLTYVYTGDLSKVNEGNYNSGTHTAEQAVDDKTITRIRLAYDNAKSGYTPTITDQAGNPISYTKAGGGTANITVQTKSLNGADNPYMTLGDDDAFFVPETGELLLGKNVSAALSGKVDNPLTQGVNEGEIRVTYEKDDWKKDDLNPVHYFACSKMDVSGAAATEKISYNGGWQTGKFENQKIEYNVGFNQTLQINSYADECFGHDIGRDIDELVTTLEEVSNLEGVQAKLNEIVEKDPDDDQAKDMLESVEKALTLLNDKVQKMFASGKSRFQDYQTEVELAGTTNGTRSARVDLVKTRLTNQLATFDNLAAENEKADITKLAVEMSSASLSYEAALLATGKIVQTSLLNFL